MAYRKRNEKSNSRKPFAKETKGSTRREASSKAAESKGCANDPMWYVIDAQMARDVGSLSFNNPLGNPITLANEDGNTTLSPAFSYGAVPGIFTIYTTPAVGYAQSETAGVNIASKNIYSYVRHDNSGHTNYDSPDLMIYLLAMDSIYSMVAAMMRIYGVAQVYSQKNKYLGKVLLQAMGVDAEDVMSNLANFRAAINIYISKVGTMCVPAIMSYYLRHLWMYTNVFKDEDIEKASLYQYVPAVLWQYSDTASMGLSAVNAFSAMGNASMITLNEAHRINPDIPLHTVNSMIRLANRLLDPIIASESLNIMSGDILKAFGKENLFKIPLIPTEYGTIPIYSDEVLYQIHNTQFASSRPMDLDGNYDTTLSSLSVVQDPNIGSGNLLFQPKFKDIKHLSLVRIMDFYKEDVTPEDVIVASRNMLTGSSMDAPEYTGGSITACGSEICMFAVVTKMSSTGAFNEAKICDGSVAATTTTVSSMYKFNFAPIFLNYASAGAPSTLWGDLGNYTLIAADTVAKLHDSAIMSMFGVPKLGNVNG